MKILSDSEYNKMMKLIKDQNDALMEAIRLLRKCDQKIKALEVSQHIDFDFPNLEEGGFNG